MQVQIKKLPKSKCELKIEVPAEEFQGFLEKAVLNLGKDIEIQGFRKGKAPRDIVEKFLGQEKILTEAAEECVRENYFKAVSQLAEEQKLEPLGQPEIEILKLAPGNPFEFRAVFSVMPEIKLPDYRAIAKNIKRKKAEISDAEVEDALKWLQKSRTDKDGKAFELNDEFAKGLGNFENLNALKQSIESGIRQEKEIQETQRVRGEILEKISQKSEIELPEILIEAQKKRYLEDLKKETEVKLKTSFEDYLKKNNKTEEGLLNDFHNPAQSQVKNSLILREIQKRENIDVSEEEVAKNADMFLQNFSTPKKVQGQFDPEQLKRYTKEVIRQEKTFQLLENL